MGVCTLIAPQSLLPGQGQQRPNNPPTPNMANNACSEDLQDGDSENRDAGSTKSYDVTAEETTSSHSLPFSTSLSNSE